MNVEVRFGSVDLANVIRSHAERRFKFALGRFGERVGQVSVRMIGSGGSGIKCRLSADVAPFRSMIIEESGADFFAAIDRAAGRIGRLFGRRLERQRAARVGRESVRLTA
jgi:putative sigma-54 modulation protein